MKKLLLAASLLVLLSFAGCKKGMVKVNTDCLMKALDQCGQMVKPCIILNAPEEEKTDGQD